MPRAGESVFALCRARWRRGRGSNDGHGRSVWLAARWLVLATSAVSSACTFPVDYSGTAYRCLETTGCPLSFRCQQGVCISHSVAPSARRENLDAGTFTAAPESDAAVDGCVGARCDGDIDAGAQADAGGGFVCDALDCDAGIDAGADLVDAGSTGDAAVSAVCDGSGCVVGCGVMSPGTGECACGLSILPDDKSFRDIQGYPCAMWQGLDCFDTERWGYTAAQAEAVRANCSTTCGVCW